jgi:protein phosphatase
MMQESILAYETGAATHPGLVRAQNEDRFFVQPQIGVWAVADGMGGHEAGDVASGAVVDSLQSIGRPASAPDLLARLEDRLLRANSHVREIADQRGGAVMGSTVVVLLIYERFYACLWSGDSRIYRVRGGEIHQLSRDHTELQELLDSGALTQEQAENWPRRNVITRAVGVHDDPEIEIDQGVLEPGDVFVLCSDGLTGHVSDAEILSLTTAADAQAACDALVKLTLERGATDNVTVVVVRYRPGEPARDAAADGHGE